MSHALTVPARMPSALALRRPPTAPVAGLAFAPFGRKSLPPPTLGDVVTWMRRFANEGKQDPVVRKLVEDICQDLEPGCYASEALAIYHWVCRNIRYMRDIQDVEYVCTPRKILERRTGDCDDAATLICAMLGACGNKAAFRVVSFSNPPQPSHVFACVETPSGWLPLDPVANRVTADMSRRVVWADTFPCT